MKLMRGRQPPGGWHFEVVPGRVLRAINEAELTELIFEYRVRNNLPIGEISRDIDRYYCERWPDACHKDATEYPGAKNATVPVAEPMLNRVTRWASLTARQMPAGGYALVPREEADRRAAICVACRQNVNWRGGCTGCSASTLALLAQIRQLRRTGRDGNLSGCALGGWDNLTAVHLPADRLVLAPEQQAQLPPACWKR